jgi:hypothetical protein
MSLLKTLFIHLLLLAFVNLLLFGEEQQDDALDNLSTCSVINEENEELYDLSYLVEIICVSLFDEKPDFPEDHAQLEKYFDFVGKRLTRDRAIIKDLINKVALLSTFVLTNTLEPEDTYSGFTPEDVLSLRFGYNLLYRNSVF